MATLAVKYRPASFEDVCGQSNIISILTNQLKEKSFKNAYLFCGPSGCGKTTLARIFAKKLNNGGGSIIEIDAASNNSVDDVRTIIKDAQFLPIDGLYKIYILDECHLFSIGAWNAMLKLIEEPPARTIFMFCTTDPQKIPSTIISRVQRYNFTKIGDKQIVNRLKVILDSEGIKDYQPDALQLIAKISMGGMRDSISTMEKCLCFNKELTVENVTKALGIISYDIMLNILKAIVDKDTSLVLNLLDTLYSNGVDLKVFLGNFLQFLSDISRYIITKEYHFSSLPQSYKSTIDSLNISKEQMLELVEGLIKLNGYVKYESNPLVFIQTFFVRSSL